ncbi:MAG TPA: superoxide dismutase, Ni [Anaerolineae bacterium]|nr:superoxide dismutase, Ni [Anaerolineae bacterium]HIP72209.1 superoxide dismutase, Ni [Anaerolineae bacterium]
MKNLSSKIKEWFPAEEVSAHCDGPCGVYDPASARIAAEAVLSMTKKMLALQPPEGNDAQAWASYLNTMSRYALIKEEQAHLAKSEVLVLWTDYFKPVHLEDHPNLHNLIWETTKLLSHCKQHVDLDAANHLMEKIKEVHTVFWATKGRDVTFYTAS